jgi:hypothetical protein
VVIIAIIQSVSLKYSIFKSNILQVIPGEVADLSVLRANHAIGAAGNDARSVGGLGSTHLESDGGKYGYGGINK